MSKSAEGITTRKVMREAAKPALDKMEQLAPRPETNKFSTGELRSLLRTKVVKDRAYEIKALVGVRKKLTNTIGKNGKRKWNAGNRAHLTEWGPQTGKRFWTHQPFARPAEAQTADIVQQRLAAGVEAILKDDFKQEQ